MPDLVTIAQTDSTNDGTGASTVLEPPQVANVLDDAILIKVTQSLNNSSSVAAINVTTPAGYTLLTDLRDSELRSWVFYKRSTGGEAIPTVTSDTSARWTCATAVVTDVDWVNGGVAQHVQNTGGGDQQSPDLTTQSGGSASAIVCFYSIERRSVLGFKYPQSRPQTFYAGAVTTGGSEGTDNAGGAGYDYIKARSTLWEGPLWDANGSGDSLAINVEVVTQNNVIPLQVADYVVQAAPTNTFQTTMNWCREICDSGKHIDGTALQTYSFGPSDVDTSTNQITLTAHGMDESMSVRFSDGGGSAPGGLADDTFYYVEPVSADAVQLRTVNEDSDNASDFYANGTTKRPIVGLTSTGSGSFTFTEARMVNAGQSVLDIFRPNAGSASNVGAFSGNYKGDAGYHQNEVGTSQRFNSTLDLTGETLTFQLQVNAATRLSRVSMTLIDEDGDWMSWQLWKSGVSPNATGQRIYQFQADVTSVQSLAAQSSGTFDSTRVRYLVVSLRGNNVSSNRFAAVNSSTSLVQLGGPLTLINGQNASLSDAVTLAEAYTSTISKPSDLQVTSLIPIGFGDGSSDVSFIDSEKSLAFPPLADGVISFEAYLANIGVAINATAASTVKLTNSQIGASLPYTFDVSAAPGATIDLTGNSYVFGTMTLDADAAYDRQLFVGGAGVSDNDAQIRNSTFLVNSQLGANNGMVEGFDGATDIETCAFELVAGTTAGHAIKITTPGTYTFTGLSFIGFGSDGTATAALFNDSGGAVSIVSDGGTTPTVRNGVGASTTLSVPPNNVSITNLAAGSRIRIYNQTTTTEVVNQIVAGTSYTATYAEGVGYSTGDTVLVYVTQTSSTTAKLPQVSTVVAASTGWSLFVQQENDSVYNTFAVDGSGVTNFSADYANNQVDVVVAANFNLSDFYAWWAYNLTTTQGIREFFGGLTAVDEGNFRIESSTLSMFLDNTTTTNIRQLDNRRLFRADGVYPVLDPTSGGGGIDVVWRNTILISTENQVAIEQARLAATAAARSRTT